MALRPLSAFGLVHAVHEWLEMLQIMGHFNGLTSSFIGIISFILLAFSFLSLAAFGGYLVLGSESTWRVSLMIPLTMEAIWVFGLFIFKEHYTLDTLPAVAEVWTRYSLAIPAGLLAAIGLVVQQRAFRRAGLTRFGQDSLWASVSFGWYSLVGQLFTSQSLLPPSTFLNENLFLQLFGFPIQALRAVAAIFASIFVIRFLRAFQVEADGKIAQLQEERLHEARGREELRAELFRRVVAAQESERQRIARDLHDETGQSLTAIGMGLRGLKDGISSRNKQGLETLSQLESLTASSLKELQRIISDLRPSHLDDLGLSAALRWYTSRLQELTSLIITVHISGEEQSLDETNKITVFRIVQEALNNIVKHSKASRTDVYLNFGEKEIRIMVRDNGVGFDLDNARATRIGRTSLGLAGMEERATLLGGTVEVHSRPAYGTEVEAVIPYHLKNEVGQ
jgi:signal transduction histidine kinase